MAIASAVSKDAEAIVFTHFNVPVALCFISKISEEPLLAIFNDTRLES